MARRKVISCLAICLCLGSGCESAGRNPERVSSPEGNFEVTMPGPVERATKWKQAGTWNLEFHLFSHSFQSEASYNVAYCDYPRSINESDAEAIFEGSQDWKRSPLRGSLVEDRAISIDGHPGRERTVEIPPSVIPGGGIQRSRVYLVDNRLYTMVVLGPKAKAASPNVADLFDSFRLQKPVLARSKPPWITVAPAGLGFSVSMPDQPKEEDIDEAHPGFARMFLASRPMVEFAVTAYSYDAPQSRDEAETRMGSMIDQVVKNLGGELVARKPPDGGPSANGEYRISYPGNESLPAGVARVCLKANGPMVYMIMASGVARWVDSPDTDTFLASFRLAPHDSAVEK